MKEGEAYHPRLLVGGNMEPVAARCLLCRYYSNAHWFSLRTSSSSSGVKSFCTQQFKPDLQCSRQKHLKPIEYEQVSNSNLLQY